MRTLPVLMATLAFGGCNIIFGPDLEVSYQTEVQQVQTVSDSNGTSVLCEVVLIATANGEDGTSATFGESLWTLRRLSDGSVHSEDRRSAAQMDFFFGTDVIQAGETLRSSTIQKRADEPFSWLFALNYRKPNGLRETTEVTAICS